jgi:type 1 glutamine amidotransferase
MIRRVLVVTGGHRVALDDFLAAVAGICSERGWVWAHATQPTAQGWLTDELAGQWDAILLHDIPGLRLTRGEEPLPVGPDAQTAQHVVNLLDAGQGIVVLHHAISAWPGWEGWAEVVGARFHYRPGRLRGVDLPASGYRHDRFTVRVTDPEHPICSGVEDFAVDDELYFAPVLIDRITPLLAHDADMSGELFQDTFDEVSHGSSTGVTCADRGADGGLHGGSTLMGWTTTAGSSPVATLLMGDGPSTFAHPMFRRLLGNALEWVSSDEAHDAAAAAPFEVPLPSPPRLP